jgi:peptidyl-dipeptidase Dcp
VTRDAAEYLALAKSQGFTGDKLEPWDWRFYAEQKRRAKYNLNEDEVKPYFSLDAMLDAQFWVANQLFGLKFKEITGTVPVYHPDVRVWEVMEGDGRHIGLFYGDFFSRESKQGGAWMSSYQGQDRVNGNLKPMVVNVLNYTKAPAGKPTLLSYDDAETLFHEFGHGLHGLLSNVAYPSLAGTAVSRDFVEFPSQVNEMWMLWPEVLANYAKHHKTGEAFPAEWIENLKKSETFNQGFETTSYMAAAILDLAWHEVSEGVSTDVETFEAKAIENYGLNFPPVPTRYRSAYFSHIFAGGYSAGYYGYIWSEVLDAASVDWFKANGGLTRANGDRFRNTLLGRGGSGDSMQMYSDFTGQKPDIKPLLKRRGLA